MNFNIFVYALKDYVQTSLSVTGLPWMPIFVNAIYDERCIFGNAIYDERCIFGFAIYDERCIFKDAIYDERCLFLEMSFMIKDAYFWEGHL